MRVEALLLDEHACDLGMSRFDPSLNPRDRALNPSGGNRVVEVQTESDKHVPRAEVHGQQLVEPEHPGLGRRDCADAGADFWIDTLARQQALRFVGEESGRDREYEPDHERRHTVQHGQIQRLSEGNAEQGRHEAEESRGVLEQNREGGGIFAAVNRPEQGRLPPVFPELTESDKPGATLEQHTEPEHGIINVSVLDRVRRLNPVQPLQNGEAGAKTEDQDRDNEGPEVELQAMPERVLSCGGLSGAPESVEEEQLVARVHGRMDRLAHHGGATGEPGRREFCRRDCRIAGECCVDDRFRRVSGHGCNSDP